MNTNYRRALSAATAVLLSGIAASLAGNLQAINLGNARPGIGAYISATVWPLFLFGAIEVMLHTPWVRSWRDGLTKWAGLMGVATVALWVSYWHLAHVLAAYGYDEVSSHLGPLAIDVTMAMATMALNRVGQARRVVTPATLATEDVDSEWMDDVATEHRERSSRPGDRTMDEERILAEWASDLDEADFAPLATQPARPVSAPPALVRSNEVKPESVPATARDLFTAWRQAPAAERPTQADMCTLVGAEHGVSPRTVRRWLAATKELI